MYFSVPLSDSHSSESGSRLFAIRSRIYNSASPDLLSEQTAGHLSQAQQNTVSLSTSQQFSRFTDQLEEDYQSLNQKLSQFIFNFNFDFGGNRHE